MVDNLASYIEHTNLRPDATADDIRSLCAEAVQFACHAVCVAPSRVALAADELSGSNVAVCAVVGFPHGNTMSVVKGVAAESVMAAGATEIDMVANIGAMKDRAYDEVSTDIALVADLVHQNKVGILKVIVETGLLNGEEIEEACRIAEASGADFVKTSTGFGPRGASVEDVRRMRQSVTPRVGVKAAGGIRDAATAVALIDAGATRIGTSASGAILAEVAS